MFITYYTFWNFGILAKREKLSRYKPVNSCITDYNVVIAWQAIYDFRKYIRCAKRIMVVGSFY